jgi:hypothetical protein
MCVIQCSLTARFGAALPISQLRHFALCTNVCVESELILLVNHEFGWVASTDEGSAVKLLTCSTH